MELVGTVMSVAGLGVLALLYALLAKQGYESSLHRNSSFGIRTPTTKQSDEAWNAGHKAASPALKVLAVVVGASAVVLAVLGTIATTNQPAIMGTLTIASYVVAVGGLLFIVKIANSAARNEETTKGK